MEFCLSLENDTRKEPYVEAQKCSKIMEFLSDARLLKTLLNVGSYYPKLVKELVKLSFGFLYLICGIKNDLITGEDEVVIARGLLYFNYKLFDKKHVFDISLPNILITGKSGLVGDENILNVAIMFGPVKSHILKAYS